MIDIAIDFVKFLLAILIGTWLAMKLVYRSLFKMIYRFITDFLKSKQYEALKREYQEWKKLKEVKKRR